ncbi:MAG TPA: aminopeptidase P family protein [Clostridia bacterium]
MNVNDKIQLLREHMKKNGLDAYIIPSPDPHLSEYVADHWKARTWISGFTGSAGTFAATMEESGLWTDGRYFIQAEKQLACSEIQLFKMGIQGVPTYTEWIAGKLKNGECVGFDGRTVSVSDFREMEKKLSAKGIRIDKSRDLVGSIWEDRPQIPSVTVFNHDIKYTGMSAKEKIEKVREEMKKANADNYLISSLDDIAWLFNIRGGDVPFICVTIAYALISTDRAYLFINPAKVPDDVLKTLNDNEVEVLDYGAVREKVEQLDNQQSIAFDVKRTNCWLYDAIPSGCRRIEIDEITAELKAVKNETEIENFKKCQISDGVAMVKFLIWLEKNVGRQEISEITVSEKLKQLRSEQPDNIGPSFETIAGYKDHGAMMHYSATENSKYMLEDKGLMVLDSGGQYLSGTTDTTRTIVFNEISEEEKTDFTLVLKAHIALASAKFLYGATGSNLDVLSRKPLWELGLDYKCGTGHGVGYCLSVHEGPQAFTPKQNKAKLEKGMIITIEPGIYREGKHGVRTENMVLVEEDEKTEFGQFMRFEPITLCPVSLKGINPDMLTGQEKEWLNTYHKKVFETLSPYLDAEEKAWLEENTRSI